MFCTHCGKPNDDSAKFCTSCGAKLDKPEAPATQPTAPATPTATPTPTAVPLPDSAPAPAGPTSEAPAATPAAPAAEAPATSPTASATVSDTSATAASTTAFSTAKQPPNKLIIALAAVLAVIVVAGIALFATWKAEMWGGKTLPDPASIVKTTASKDGKSATIKAKDVTEALKLKGINAKTEKVFSGKESGAFLGYDGLKQGQRVSAGTVVTVQESAGPGVPKNTLGKKAEQVVDTLEGMNVPVHYKKVYVSDTKKNPEGTVVATYPAAGTGVQDSEKDKGIYVGVATKGDGTALPLDVMGKSVDDIKSQLESEGHSVTVEKRFSSKQYVGKVAGADPAPGSSLDSGDDVTLYEGIDATSMKDAFTDSNLPETGGDALLGTTDAIDGRWCTNDGQCITIEDHKITEGGSDNSDYNSSYDGYLVACDAVQQAYCSNSNADYLINQDYGAFELLPHISLTNFWSNGKMYDSNGVHMDDSWPKSGEYHLQDLFLVVPTGANLEGLESKGYFDKDALATAKKEKAVDTDRPFILWRDPSKYETTTAPYSGTGMNFNPFLPYNGYSGDKSNVVKMKPAPSDANAYYRVESSDPDWDSLPDAEVKGAGKAAKSGSDDSDSKSDSKADTALFKNVADQYRFFSTGNGSAFIDMTVKDDGSFTGEANTADMNSGEPTYKAPRITYPFSGKFSSIKKNSAGGYDLQCDSSSFKWEKDQYTDESGLSPCGTWHWYPAGTPWSSMASGDKVKYALAYGSQMDSSSSDSYKSNLLYDEDAERSAFYPYSQN
ncbi:PASTA domain-containing protein [Bifidobacterium miconisargentati]|uniref:PASTA domain-containing protein n=1 Tax=Bifidobacterium miconisargentati TaxID=2834437 RepID=UPI001BDBC027|nr:PASTA domain-containing protein [Bifidobacterium miconisargentati]MBW3089951.1 PASTA domain-containing protein [Bifidobacterium miconisargentati]